MTKHITNEVLIPAGQTVNAEDWTYPMRRVLIDNTGELYINSRVLELDESFRTHMSMAPKPAGVDVVTVGDEYFIESTWIWDRFPSMRKAVHLLKTFVAQQEKAVQN